MFLINFSVFVSDNNFNQHLNVFNVENWPKSLTKRGSEKRNIYTETYFSNNLQHNDQANDGIFLGIKSEKYVSHSRFANNTSEKKNASRKEYNVRCFKQV